MQKSAYEMLISDWSSDVCSSDLVAGDFQFVGGHELRLACRHPHLALLGHAGQALGQLADDLLLEGAQLVERELRLSEVDAVVAGVLRLVDHRRRVQQRLGGNAADVEADATELRMTLHQHGVEAEVSRAERGGVAAGAGAEDDDSAFDVGLAAGDRKSTRLNSSP